MHRRLVLFIPARGHVPVLTGRARHAGRGRGQARIRGRRSIGSELRRRGLQGYRLRRGEGPRQVESIAAAGLAEGLPLGGGAVEDAVRWLGGAMEGPLLDLALLGGAKPPLPARLRRWSVRAGRSKRRRILAGDSRSRRIDVCARRSDWRRILAGNSRSRQGDVCARRSDWRRILAGESGSRGVHASLGWSERRWVLSRDPRSGVRSVHARCSGRRRILAGDPGCRARHLTRLVARR